MSIVVSNDSSAVRRVFETVKNTARKNSPELLVVTGTVAFIATLWSMHKTTLKTKDIVDSANEEVNAINETPKSADYTDADAVEDIKKVKRSSAKKIIKAAAPTAILAVGTLGCFFGADYIRRQRHAALFAAAEMTLQSYNSYRKGVIDKYGSEVDQELKYKLFKKEEIVEEEDPKTGKKKKKKEAIWRRETDEYGYSQFAMVFSEDNPNYQRNAYVNGKDTPYGVYNLNFVVEMEKRANSKLRRQGFLTLNEAYEMLGFDKTKAGASAGWIFNINDPKCVDDTHIDFGVLNRGKDEFKAILLGDDKSFVVDFNIDTLDVWESFDDTPLHGLLPGRSR